APDGGGLAASGETATVGPPDDEDPGPTLLGGRSPPHPSPAISADRPRPARSLAVIVLAAVALVSVIGTTVVLVDGAGWLDPPMGLGVALQPIIEWPKAAPTALSDADPLTEDTTS